MVVINKTSFIIECLLCNYLRLACRKHYGTLCDWLLMGGPITLLVVPPLCSWSWVISESKLSKVKGARQWTVSLHGLCTCCSFRSPCHDFPHWWTTQKCQPSKPFISKGSFGQKALSWQQKANEDSCLARLALIATNTFSSSCVLHTSKTYMPTSLENSGGQKEVKVWGIVI